MTDRVRIGSEPRVIALVGATFLVVGGLLVHGLLTQRSHRLMIDATLGDYSGFAAERVATELDQTFTALFLDHTGLARSAHYNWVADPSTSVDRPVASRAVPASGIAGCP